MAITEIAMQAGFNSLSTFNRAFRTINGCTPTEYPNRFCRYNKNKTAHPTDVRFSNIA